MQSQLEGLKNQIKPHFLFNSLNALAGLIPKDGKRAIRYVNKLSAVFRYLLEIDDTPLISLEEELAFLHAYAYLQKERFGDNLVVDIDIDPSYYHKMIVPLSLQILFENVIKHNILSDEKPLRVNIFINDQGKITVENNLQLKDLPPSSTKIGLENIKKRYAFIVENAVDVQDTSSSFSVSLPLVQNPEVILSV
ncbi:MAG: histidine kinase [Saprospiraceae bacterium]|nr:histidine kinase [Saprospiraceae bacterium]